MRALALFLATLICVLAAAEESLDHTPQLLLTPQRLKRLKRDRQRQTVRWLNFESRVKSVSDSPERGFELALYYAVTGDQARGKEAVAWGMAHPCEARQLALILDWASGLISDADRAVLKKQPCAVRGTGPAPIVAARDALFSEIARGEDPQGGAEVIKSELSAKQGPPTGARLYALCEYVATIRAVQHVDLRESAPQFFSQLPLELLLGLKPEQVEHPDWMTHVAAQALVSLDPNLESSQFLQAWAMEERQMVREGPGVAYEFLWGDPYLPGIAYQNLDPWFYDPDGGLFARTSWEPDACWVGISQTGVQQENCPAAWHEKSAQFGNLELVPFIDRCVEAPRRTERQVVILSRIKPHQRLTYREDKRLGFAEADASGMVRLGSNVEGKVCAAARQ